MYDKLDGITWLIKKLNLKKNKHLKTKFNFEDYFHAS